MDLWSKFSKKVCTCNLLIEEKSPIHVGLHATNYIHIYYLVRKMIKLTLQIFDTKQISWNNLNSILVSNPFLIRLHKFGIHSYYKIFFKEYGIHGLKWHLKFQHWQIYIWYYLKENTNFSMAIHTIRSCKCM
jgi:hypothetical protein